MIKYRLVCANDHEFESWFSSGADFDRLEQAGHLSCVVCGGSDVKKALMAPRVSTAEETAPLSQRPHPAEQALRALRAHVESTAENVGRNFAREARRIHNGDSPERPIYGEAKVEDARALIEDGIPVTPLPWRSGSRN